MLGAGLCGGLMPACVHTAGPRSLEANEAGPRLPQQRPPAEPFPARAPAAPGQLTSGAPDVPGAGPGPETLRPPGPRSQAAVPDMLRPRRPVAVLEAPAEPALQVAAATKPTSAPDEKPREAPLMAAMRCYLEKRPAEALEQLKGLDPLPQEVLLGVLPLAARFAEPGAAPVSPEEAAVLLDQVTSLEAPFRGRAPLVIDQMCFCHRVDSFGVYDPLPDEPLFQPGDWALLYVELRNFSTERRDQGAGRSVYVTHLISSAEVCDYAGRKVWPAGPDRLVFQRKGPDESRSPWHDYFDSCSFRVPRLPAGRYTLWIQVEDGPTKRVARHSADFRVGAPANGLGS